MEAFFDCVGSDPQQNHAGKRIDIYILPGTPVKAKVRGQMEQLGEERCSVQDCADLLQEIYALAGGRSMKRLEEVGDDDFSFSLAAVGRFRCSAYRQRGSYGAVLRAVPFSIPDAEKLHIPKAVMDLFSLKRGMVLVTGPAGSGKSTTLACLIDRINRERTGHIITIEDPIEYLHGHKGCLVSQRKSTRIPCPLPMRSGPPCARRPT